MIVFADIETEGLDAKKIWCICTKEKDTGITNEFLNVHIDMAERARFVEYAKKVTRWVGHNFINFDGPVINRIVGPVIDMTKIVDTLVVSMTVDFGIGSHSLATWGEKLGYPKDNFKDFEGGLTEEMLSYCHRDVEVTEQLFKHFSSQIKDKQWSQAMRLEHDVAIICQEMHEGGFEFDINSAEAMHLEITKRLQELEERIHQAFPPKLEVVKEIKYRTKADGELFKNVAEAIDTYPKTEIVGDMLLCYDYITFNPGSTKQRIERLWDAGWNPIDRTVGHRMALRDGNLDKLDYYNKYGWTVSEENLKTLPKSAPEGAHALAEWLTLEGRRSTLSEWLQAFSHSNDTRIHGSFMHIGSWTGRMAHRNPNMGNIPSVFHGEPKTAVEKVKSDYDGRFRDLWTTPEGCHLVGTDASGIQLRILADIMESKQYIKAIIEGRSEDQTDIHNLNRKALGLAGITRDMAKTFIYAFLLGAGTAKIAQILKTNMGQAGKAVNNFTESIEGLSRLKKKVIPEIASQGYFRGYDGRRVVVPSEHKTLAGMLQNGETLVMKYATRRWMEEASNQGLDFKVCTWVHDEWQTEVRGSLEDAERLAKIQRDSIQWAGLELGIMCPLAGESSIGKSWKDTH
jgi:DNA polymerase-1